MTVSATSLEFNVAEKSNKTKEEIIMILRKEIVTTRGTLLKKFIGYFMVSLFSQIQTSYRVRSKGGKDVRGDSWQPLAKSTVRKKRNRKRRTAGAADLIMIDTKRSLKSYKPGTASRRGYTPSSGDQTYNINGLKINFGSNVEYLKFPASRRPIITGSAAPDLVRKATQVALSKMTRDIKGALK